ncbi:MAG: spore cortex-lytic enzyme [Clostridiales bacterium]|jgi:N-acetylmuramoyl-L-alanine amidase|nr:spore cortex-lytic enzyme [Clostridiales bacterium]
MNNKKKLAAALMLLFVINIMLICVVQSTQQASAAYKTGSTGAVVSDIQKRLKNWGYYSGGVDGVYGKLTEKAVRYFQSKNGLTVDGIVGNQTLAALGISAKPSTTSNDLELLARCISAEARGEPYNGQVAVGAVILNRVDHPSFPNTIAGVIYQKGAFTAVADGQINLAATESARKAAREAMSGNDPSGGAIYYYNPAKATSKWIFSRPVIMKIGTHVFCT